MASIQNPSYNLKLSEQLLCAAKAMQRRGDELCEAGKEREAKRDFKRAGRLYEQSGDNERYITDAAHCYSLAAVSYSAAGKGLRLRRVYTKMLEHYTALLRASADNGDISIMCAYQSRQIATSEGIRLYSPFRIAMRKAEELTVRYGEIWVASGNISHNFP